MIVPLSRTDPDLVRYSIMIRRSIIPRMNHLGMNIVHHGRPRFRCMNMNSCTVQSVVMMAGVMARMIRIPKVRLSGIRVLYRVSLELIGDRYGVLGIGVNEDRIDLPEHQPHVPRLPDLIRTSIVFPATGSEVGYDLLFFQRIRQNAFVVVVGIYSHVELPLIRIPDHGASTSDVPSRFVSPSSSKRPCG